MHSRRKQRVKVTVRPTYSDTWAAVFILDGKHYELMGRDAEEASKAALNFLSRKRNKRDKCYICLEGIFEEQLRPDDELVPANANMSRLH